MNLFYIRTRTSYAIRYVLRKESITSNKFGVYWQHFAFFAFVLSFTFTTLSFKGYIGKDTIFFHVFHFDIVHRQHSGSGRDQQRLPFISCRTTFSAVAFQQRNRFHSSCFHHSMCFQLRRSRIHHRGIDTFIQQ